MWNLSATAPPQRIGNTVLRLPGYGTAACINRRKRAAAARFARCKALMASADFKRHLAVAG